MTNTLVKLPKKQGRSVRWKPKCKGKTEVSKTPIRSRNRLPLIMRLKLKLNGISDTISLKQNKFSWSSIGLKSKMLAWHEKMQFKMKDNKVVLLKRKNEIRINHRRQKMGNHGTN